MSPQTTIARRTSELVLLLLPLFGVFACIGVPGMRLGPVVVPPYQLLLVLALLTSMTIRRDGWLRGLLRTPGVVPFSLAMLWVCACSTVAHAGSQAEVRELKNTVAPIIILLVVLARALVSIATVERALTAIGLGVLGSMAGVFTLLGTARFAVRGFKLEEFSEATGFTYIWLGVAGVALIAVGYITLTSQNRLRRSLSLAFVSVGLAVLVVSGTRGAIAGVVAVPFVLLCSRFLPRLWITAGVGIAIFSVFAVSVFPNLVVGLFPAAAPIAGFKGAEGAGRLLEQASYLEAIGARFMWWDVMLDASDPMQLLFGTDYLAALQRTGYLAHPHNVFVWMMLMGGLPAAVLLCWALSAVLAKQILGCWDPDPMCARVARATTGLIIPVFLVLVTNSWAGGTHLAFATALGISTLSRQSRLPS